jgi:hypothetical protein
MGPRRLARLAYVIALLAAHASSRSGAIHAQLAPLRIKIVREAGSTHPLNYETCVRGTMYVLSGSFREPPDTLAEGVEFAHTLELPWKSDVGHISSIPAGRYLGSVRTDGTLGWRIELRGTGHRTNIQIHTGSRVANTSNIEGCILPGRRLECPPPPGTVKTDVPVQCCLKDSGERMAALKAAHGAHPDRPIEVLIVEAVHP